MAYYQLPSLQAVDKAERLINRKVIRTPIVTSSKISALATSRVQDLDIELFFKCENYQHTGSFKFRGASHFITTLSDYELAKGVVAYSTGNHALAVARAAQIASRERNINIPIHVVVPHNCSATKVAAAKTFGAVVIHCDVQPEARIHLAYQIARETGAIVVPPADHENIALGQATLVREFLDQVKDAGPSLDAVIVPSGGGGLLVGAAAVCKPCGILAFGAEPARGGPGLAQAIQKGERTKVFTSSDTIADGLRSLTGEANFEIIKKKENVDSVFGVGEDQIRDSLKLVLQELGFIIEPSAAVPLAAALFCPEFHKRMMNESKRRIKHKFRIGVVLTGCNISEADLALILPEL